MIQKTLGDYSSTGSDCPTCGETFKSEHGVKIHHKRSHGESIAGVEVECAWCGEVYTEKPYRVEDRENLFCDRECMGKWRSENFVGENATNYKGGPVDVECQNCGDTFEVERAIYYSDSDKQNPTYCSNDCQYKDLQDRYTGDVNPNWDGGTITKPCENCGELMETYHSQGRKFCDYECLGEWEKEAYAGSGNPHWLGGRADYGAGWTPRLSHKVKRRDQARCVDCGISENKTAADGAYLHVHHICNARQSSNPAVYNAERNLATLCAKCHGRWEKYAPGLPPNITQHNESSRVSFERNEDRIR